MKSNEKKFWDTYLNTAIDAMENQGDVEKTKRLRVYNKTASNTIKKVFIESSIRHLNPPTGPAIEGEIPEAEVVE